MSPWIHSAARPKISCVQRTLDFLKWRWQNSNYEVLQMTNPMSTISVNLLSDLWQSSWLRRWGVDRPGQLGEPRLWHISDGRLPAQHENKAAQFSTSAVAHLKPTIDRFRRAVVGEEGVNTPFAQCCPLPGSAGFSTQRRSTLSPSGWGQATRERRKRQRQTINTWTMHFGKTIA